MPNNPFGPREIKIVEVAVNTLGSLIAGIVGSVFILVVMAVAGNFFNISGDVIDANIGTTTNGMFPFILSLVALFGISITMFATYYVLTLTNSTRYKRSHIIISQIGLFGVVTYIFMSPIYIYMGITSYQNIMFAFLLHTLLVSFGTSIIIEVLNNYRYILIGLYGSFAGLFFSLIFSAFIFTYFSAGFAKLLSLLFLLPIINASITGIKGLFELAYFHYNRYTNLDQLGDIFYQLEMEEKEENRTGI